MPLSLIPIAMGLAEFIPSIAKMFGGSKAEKVASKVIDVAKTVTGIGDPKQAVEAIRANPELVMKFQAEISKLDYNDFADVRKDIRDSGRLSRAVRPYIAITFHTVIMLMFLFKGAAPLKEFLSIKLVTWGSLTMTMGGSYVLIIFFYFLTKGIKDYLIGKNPIGV